MALAERKPHLAGTSVERILDLRIPLEVAVSPDGARIAFPLAAAYRGDAARTAIWAAPVDGSDEPRRLTWAAGEAALPRWSPDGGALAFASDRDHAGRMSLFVLRSGPGDAEPLGDIAGSVEDVRWSGDGRELLVLAADVGSDRAGIQAATRIEEVGSRDEDPRVARPQQAWRRVFRINAASGETVEVGPERLTVWELDWRGGDTAAAIVSDDASESGWYRAYVALLDLAEHSASAVYRPRWQLASPRLAPDGETVAFAEGFCSDRGVLAGVATVVERGEARELPLDADVTWLDWRDAVSLRYAGWRGMRAVCGVVGLDGSSAELSAGEETIGVRNQPRLSAAGGVVAAVRESADEPQEVCVLEHDGTWRAVTRLNEEAGRAVPPVDWETVEWQGRDGLELEGLLALPPGRTAEALPLAVLVHGGPTGTWSYQFAPSRGLPQVLADAGYAVLLPNPRGSAGRGQGFARANLGDLGGEDFHDILAGVDACVEGGYADGERVAILGGSYGGFMSAWAVTQTDRFSAAVAIACVSDWLSFHLTTNIGRFDELFLDADPYDPGGAYAQRSPILNARRCRTPTLVLHGEKDLCTPLGQGQELYQALVEAGVETELVVYPREGHGFLEREHQLDYWERIRAWLDKHVAAA